MESISKIKLKNQAGAITMLKGYVKVASDSEAYYKCGATDNFGLSLKPWGIALKFLFLHHENILFPND